MKIHNIILCGVAALALGTGTLVRAETLTGKVVAAKGNDITVQQADGTQKTLKVNDDTTYRKKKMMKKDKAKQHKKMKRGEMASYTPLVEEDDWVEVVYSPTTGDGWIVEDVTVYDN